MVDLAAERSNSDRGSDRDAPASAYDPCHERGELRSKTRTSLVHRDVHGCRRRRDGDHGMRPVSCSLAATTLSTSRFRHEKTRPREVGRSETASGRVRLYDTGVTASYISVPIAQFSSRLAINVRQTCKFRESECRNIVLNYLLSNDNSV